MTKNEFFSRSDEHFFTDDWKAVAQYCKREWPKECEHIIRIADEVCRNYFLFDLKWDLERTWEPVQFPDGEIDWEYQPGDDPEFIYQFNRHRYFICLGQAYQLTGDEVYAENFVRLLMDWITRVKRTDATEKTAWRILEAGFRGEFWVKAIRYFKASPALTDQVIDAFYHCLVEHAEFIIKMHSPYRYISNWGVIENHGLFEIGIAMPDENLRKRYTEIALEHLEMEARMQIMEDGVHWEQSPGYHNEVLHCYEDVLILAARNDIEVPVTILDKVYRMAYADLAWKKPDHCQFMMGDSDHVDIRDYISVAAFLFKDCELKYGGYPKLDFESVWDLGIESAGIYEDMETREPDFTSIAMADSGNYYLRDGWDEDGNLLHFHCGTLGAGHGHSDKLHVDLVIHGEDVLTDSGRYTYVAGDGRFEFKDPPAHNTITVDQKYFTVCKDAWECSKLCQPVKQGYKFDDFYEYIQGGHLGYMEEGIYINRRILHIKPDLYLIMDEMYGSGNHEYTQYWNFGETGKTELIGPGSSGSEGWKAIYRGTRGDAEFLFLNPKANAEALTGRISRDYNKAVERTRIQVTLKEQGSASFITVICGSKAGEKREVRAQKIPVHSALKGITYPDSMAEAVKISLDGREYVVIICHQEVNSPTDLVESEGYMGFGNVIVFDKEKGRIAGTVMNY